MKRADPSRLRKRPLKPKPILSRAELERHLLAGGRVSKTMPRIESEPVSYFDPVSNRTVGVRAVQWAMENGKLMGCNDGLFGEHQTFEMAT